MVLPYICAHGRNFNLPVERHTVKPPNFISGYMVISRVYTLGNIEN